MAYVLISSPKFFVFSILLLIVDIGSASTENEQVGNMGNAAAWCASIEVTGRFTATDAQGRYLGVSDSALLAGATVENQVVDNLVEVVVENLVVV